MAAVVNAALLAVAVAQQQPDRLEQAGDIIITGERVRRPVRDTASSVAVLNQAEIDATGADRVDGILALIPNVQLGNGSQGPTIRGQDTTGPLQALPAFLGGNRPRMTVVVDGRAVTYNEFVFGALPLWDVERIEVFRSPQTTTQGQNSIAGAVFVNTADPTSAPEYRARATAGNFNLRHASALASGPVAGDDIAFRVAGDLRYSRTTSRIDDAMEGADPNHDVYGLLRAKLLVKPSAVPGTRLTLAYTHTHSQAPQIVGVDAPFRKRRDEDAGYGVFRINVDSLTATVRHQASEELTADFVLTAGDSKSRRLAIPGFGQTRNDGRDWSAEAILNWSPNDRLDLVGGVSRSHVALKQLINLSLLSGSIGRFRDWQDGIGIFTDASVALSSRATFSAGLRYQRDRQERFGALTATTFAIPVDFVGTFDAWLPKLTFAYDVTAGLRIGAMVQKAYNPGGTTIRVDTARPDSFKAERLWDYELFARADIAGGRAKLAANFFYYDMRNAQRAESILVFTPSGRPAGFANLFNVPKARSYGAEGQLIWRFSDALAGTVAIGLLDTKVLRSDAESAGLDGKQFDRAPHLTAATTADWRPDDRLRLSLQMRYHSAYFTDRANSPDVRIGSAALADARAEYRVGKAVLFGQVRNIFDALHMRDLGTPDSGEAEDPRSLAVGIEAPF